jgi:hypothetical protein
VILATAIVAQALLAGWIAGLTAHAFRRVRWRDPGARAGWIAGAGPGGSMPLLASVGLCLLARPASWLAIVFGSTVAGAIAGWHVSESLRRDRSRDRAPIQGAQIGDAKARVDRSDSVGTPGGVPLQILDTPSVER